MLASCGGEAEDSEQATLDLGDGLTITADADGNFVAKGADGLAIRGGEGGAAKVELPLGLALPPRTEIVAQTDADLPGMGRMVQISGQSALMLTKVAAHFRDQADAAGLSIDVDEPGTGTYVIAASRRGGDGGFQIEITPQARGSAFDLAVTSGKTVGGLMSGG